MRWYRNVLENSALEEELAAQLNPKLELPALLVTAKKDAFGIPAVQLKTTADHIADLRTKSVEAGHWLMLEEPDQVNRYLKEFFEEIEDNITR